MSSQGESVKPISSLTDAKIEIFTSIISEIKKQGILIIVMCIAIFYFYRRQEKLEIKIDNNNSEYIKSIKKNNEDYKNLTIQMIQAIDRNTEALERIEDTH